MMWLDERKNIWRSLLLALLVVAFIGPWLSDQIYVPVEYPCGPDYVRISGEYCGSPAPGFINIFVAVGSIFMGVGILIVEGLPGFQALLHGLFQMCIFVPIISSVFLLEKGNNFRLKVIQILTLILGFSSAYYYFVILKGAGLAPALWGINLFLLVMIGGVVMEGLLLVVMRVRPMAS
jgi:hypothetical protein